MGRDWLADLELDAEKWRRLRETKEYQIQGKMFESWVALGAIGYAEIRNNVGFVWCPIHERLEKLQLECGLTPIII